MSFSVPSLVSPTSAFTERTFSLPGWASVQRTTASIGGADRSVLVRTIGVSIVPSSLTCVEPASLPKALPTNTAPATFSWKRLPPCGRMAVTPVRTVSPSIDGALPDAHAGDVGDGVEPGPGVQRAGRDPEVPRPRAPAG